MEINKHERDEMLARWQRGHKTDDRDASVERSVAQLIEEARASARAEGEREKAAARSEIEQEVSRAREMLRDQVAALAVAGAERILRREVDARTHADLLESIKRQL